MAALAASGQTVEGLDRQVAQLRHIVECPGSELVTVLTQCSDALERAVTEGMGGAVAALAALAALPGSRRGMAAHVA